jgi:hypothetical protein
VKTKLFQYGNECCFPWYITGNSIAVKHEIQGGGGYHPPLGSGRRKKSVVAGRLTVISQTFVFLQPNEFTVENNELPVMLFHIHK